MSEVSKIAFSCYAVTDMARARKFYAGVPGLKPSSAVDLPDGNTICIYKRNAG